MTCPTCGFQNTPGSGFCANCGSRLPAPPPQPPAATPGQQDHSARVYDAPDDSLTVMPDEEPPRRDAYETVMFERVRPERLSPPPPTQQSESPTFSSGPPPASPAYQPQPGPSSPPPASPGSYPQPAPSGPPVGPGYQDQVAAAPVPQAPARRFGSRGCLLTIGGLLLLLVAACVGLGFFVRSYGLDAFNLGVAAGLQDVGTARDVADDSTPIEPTSTFGPSDTVFITYSVGGAQSGEQLSVRIFYEDELVDEGQQDFESDGNYNAYFELPGPREPGQYRAELTYKDTTETVEWEVAE